MAEETQPPAGPEEPDEPEIDWKPVATWPARAQTIMMDIEAIQQAVELMAGSADDSACQVLTDFLASVLLARRRELAVTVLTDHGIEVPEPGTLQTPQQRMSSGLQHLADEVRARRPDIHPDKQPPTERSRRHLPDMKT
jgi:hypothetical protein